MDLKMSGTKTAYTCGDHIIKASQQQSAHYVPPKLWDRKRCQGLMTDTNSLFPPGLNNYSERQTSTLTRERLIKSSALISGLLIAGLKYSAPA